MFNVLFHIHTLLCSILRNVDIFRDQLMFFHDDIINRRRIDVIARAKTLNRTLIAHSENRVAHNYDKLQP